MGPNSKNNRETVKKHLLESPKYQGLFRCKSVQDHLVLRGQHALNLRWPPGTRPASSPLADFLTQVWCEVWSRTPLR